MLVECEPCMHLQHVTRHKAVQFIGMRYEVSFDVSFIFLCLMMLQVINVKAIEKDLKAQKAKLSEDGAAYKSLEAKVVERERTGKAWFMSSLFRDIVSQFCLCAEAVISVLYTVRQLHESLKQLEK